jgi:hypothetical protein
MSITDAERHLAKLKSDRGNRSRRHLREIQRTEAEVKRLRMCPRTGKPSHFFTFFVQRYCKDCGMRLSTENAWGR